MKKLLKVLLLVILVPASAHAATTTIGASMKIWLPLSVDVTTQITLPTIYTTNHASINSGSASVVETGTNGTDGVIRITGQKNKQVTLSYASTVTMTDGGANSIVVTFSVVSGNNTNTQTLDASTGILDFTIRGTIPSVSVDRVNGDYTTGTSAAVTVLYS